MGIVDMNSYGSCQIVMVYMPCFYWNQNSKFLPTCLWKSLRITISITLNSSFFFECFIELSLANPNTIDLLTEITGTLGDIKSYVNFNHDDVIKWENFSRSGPLWGESTGHRRIPFTKASDAELWCFLWYPPEQTVEQAIEMLVIASVVSVVGWSFQQRFNSTAVELQHWGVITSHCFTYMELIVFAIRCWLG